LYQPRMMDDDDEFGEVGIMSAGERKVLVANLP
jgi:hypothetical protein